MPLKKLVSYAAKESYRNLKQHLIVVLFLLITFCGIFLISVFKSTSDDYMRRKAAEIVAGDLVVSAFQEFESSQIQALESEFEVSDFVDENEFRGMATGGGRTLFVTVKAVGSKFPLRGRVELDKFRRADAAELEAEKLAWVYSDVLSQLDLQVGDQIQIGEASFKIDGVVTDDPGAFRQGSGFAPRLYIGLRFAEETGLLGPMSRVAYKRYYTLESVPRDFDSKIEAMQEAPEYSSLRFVTPDRAIKSLLRFFSDFQNSLDSIVLFLSLLCALSAFYLFQNHFVGRLRSAAIYAVFGMSLKDVVKLYVLETLLLCFTALLGAFIVGSSFATLVNSLVLRDLSWGFILELSFFDYFLTSLAALFLSCFFSIPIILRVRSIRMAGLFSEGSLVPSESLWRSSSLALSVISLGFFVLSAWVLESIWLALGFSAVVVLLWVLGIGVFRILAGWLGRHLVRLKGVVRISVTNLANLRLSSVLCFLIIVSASFVFVTVGTLYVSFERNVESPETLDAPKVFAFNIPEEEIESLSSYVKSSGQELRYASPMILTRLKTKNGEAFGEMDARRFPLRISYRSKILDSEEVIEGEYNGEVFDPQSGALPSLSIGEGFSSRYGIKLGDVLEFDVQGIGIKSRVDSIRRVDWMSFHPNFFLQFQPGVLDDAPKTFVASIHSGESSLPESFIFQLVKEFPNISVIDVQKTVDRIIGIAGKMSGALRAFYLLGLGICFIILLALIRHNLQSREYEMQVLQAFGATKQKLYQIYSLEYGLLAFVAVLMGSFWAFVALFTVARNFLNFELVIDPLTTLLAFVVPVAISLLLSFFTTWHMSQKRRLEHLMGGGA